MSGNIKTINICTVPCACKGQTVTKQNRQGVWSVVCLKCGAGVSGFKTESAAVGAWGREVFTHDHP